MPQFKLHLLGAPSLEMDGKPVTLDTRKAIALLAYIVMTAAGGAHSHTRDALSALLWPDLDQSRARAALRRTLSPLRQAVDWRILDVSRDNIGLRPAAPGAPFWVDAVEFKRLLHAVDAHHHGNDPICDQCRALLEQAVALYRDDFMSGFSLRDAPDFDEWQYFEGEQLRRAFAAALEALVHFYARRAAYDHAIELARRHLSLDPLAEQAHRSLMQLYAWSGQRSLAVRQYRDAVRILEQELGVPPLEETTALYEQILGGDLPAPAPGAPPAALEGAPPPTLAYPSSVTLPLVGRAVAWERLQAAHSAAQQNGHLLVVEGEAGVGKTRLVDDFLRRAPGVIIRARCYEGESHLAYAPFTDALRAALEQADEQTPGWQQRLPAHWLAEASGLLPELRPDLLHAAAPAAGAISGPAAQSRFFEAIWRLLLALTARPGTPQPPAPSVLFLDDVHWADDASLDLLAYLVKRLARHPLLVIVTWRPEALSAPHRLHILLSGAQRNNQATRIALQRLSEAEVGRILEHLQSEGHPLSAQWQQSLYDQTEGLPFFIVEYLKSALEGGQPPPPLAPYEEAASGAAAVPGNWQIPASVRGLLQSRLDGIDEIGWQLLNTAAVIGRSFHFDICRIASGRSEEEAVVALEGLMARGLIEEVQGAADTARDPLYDFSHNQIRALVYQETSLVRRRLLHRRVAGALAQHAPDASQAAQIARHYLLAGQEPEAAGYFYRAGEHAAQLHANATALSHLHTALALGHPLGAAIHEAIGDLQTLLGDYENAVSAYEAAAALAPAAGQLRLEHKLGSVYDRCGQWPRAESHFQAALASFAADEAGGENLQARIYADWSLTAHHQGSDRRALQLAEQALQLAEAAQDHTALAQVHNILGILARHAGNLPQARNHLQRSIALATDAGFPSARIAALNNLALVHSAAQQPAQARQTLEEALELCRALGDRHREAALLNNLADLHHAAGRAEEAMAHLKRAAAIFVEVGSDVQEWQPEIWKLSEW